MLRKCFFVNININASGGFNFYIENTATVNSPCFLQTYSGFLANNFYVSVITKYAAQHPQKRFEDGPFKFILSTALELNLLSKLDKI